MRDIQSEATMKNQIRLQEVVTIMYKHKFKILAAFSATLLTALIGTLLVSPVYESTASLLLKFGREYVYRPEVGDRSTNIPRTEMVGIINAEIQILTSKDLVDRVLSDIGIRNLYPDLDSFPDESALKEAARFRFHKALTVQGMEDSGVIRVSFQHNDPRMTARVVTQLVEHFKDKHLQTFVDPKTSSFLESKAIEYAKQLRETEQKLKALKQEHNTYDLGEQRKLLLAQRAQLDASLKASRDQIAELGKKLAALQAQIGIVMENARGYIESDRYRVLDDGKSKLLQLQLQEQQLLKKYTENSQHITQIRNEIKTVKTFLEQQEQELRNTVPASNPVYQELQRNIMMTNAEYQSQQAKSKVLQQQLTQLDIALAKLSLPENDLRELQRQLTTGEQNYQTYANKLEEARIIEDMNRARMTNISVIQAAAVPFGPIKPRMTFNLAIGFFLGLTLGIGFAFLAEFLSQTFSTPQAVERRLRVPVLSVVPYRENHLRR
jgi:uncharacterized protein involved in exopolysaccharide biosynthesis